MQALKDFIIDEICNSAKAMNFAKNNTEGNFYLGRICALRDVLQEIGFGVTIDTGVSEQGVKFVQSIALKCEKEIYNHTGKLEERLVQDED